MLAALLNRYPAHAAIGAALLVLTALWAAIGVVGYALWSLAMAALGALLGVLV
ncbi:hypothetical protein [Micromonospora sp. DT227]|uniref:hypothetical protein n=1 Tax=Micromonospora sp. DT227 TaxID=3393433 RepID=UPI003CE95937